MISKATDVMVVVKRHKGTSQVIPLQTQTTVNHAGVVNKEVFFIFQQRIWVLSKGKEKQFIKPTFPNKLPYSDYHQNKGFETKSQMEAAKRIYGDNALPLDIPEFFSLLVDHMFAPFFVFQMFCVMLWCLDEYWMYSIFTGFMMVMMECTVVFQRIRNMKTLRQMGEVPIIDVVVMRCGKFEKIRSNELLPLDLMIVPNNTHCPADAVLISGSCVMNEAMLTGESTPQLKAAMEDNKNQCLMTKRDTCHMLFGGTMCLLASGNTNVKSHDIKEAAMAVVIKTGFETKQGKLLRTILNSQSRVSENSSEAFGFIGILLIFAIAASGYLLRRGLADPTKDRWKLFLHCVQIITSVVPTELPMQLSLAVNASLIALMRLRIFCTEPFRVPFAGKLDTCCFDKTGTITTDEMLFSGVDPLDEYGIRHKLETVPKTCETVLAGCHALVHLEAGEIAGDAMEKAAVETLGYRCLKEDTVVKYKKPVDKECGPVKGKKSSFNKTVSELPSNEVETTIHIIQRFPFNPVVRRMSCVITTGSDKLIVCKGSPEGIQALCVPDSIPENYTDTYEKYAAKGYRVIALASKQVPQEFRSKASLSSITRDEAEKDLIFAGFAIFTCPLKKDAEETIKSLIVGSHRCVVITGDNIQTALEVSRIVGIAPCKKHMIARQRPEDQLQESVNETLMFPTMLFDSADFTHTPHELSIKDVRANTYVPAPWHKMSLEKRTKELHEKFDLCVDASQMSSAVFAKVVESCTDLVSVWSRCNPSQKEDVISRLKALGHVVLMAGDGTNDVGGLKQAHVGIAVLNSHAHEISAKERKEQDAINAASKKNQITATAQGNIGTTYEDPEKLPPIPPGYTLAPMPPPLSPDASFMMRLKYEMAIATRKAQIKHFEKIATNKGKNTAAVAASPNPHGDIMAQAKSIASGDSDFGTLMESAFNDNFDDESNPMIKLGDASIAAPFTAKSKRLMAVVDIVRNGRSTLVTTLQMYKILALNSLVNAYSMSVLHSDGIKMGEKQMLVTGVVLSICFLSMARCQPSEHLSPSVQYLECFTHT